MAKGVMRGLGSVALLELFLAAAWAGIVPTDILQRITHRIVAVVAMRAVYMPVVLVCVVVVVIAIGTVHMCFMVHRYCYSGIKLPGIISPLVEMCTRRPSIRPVFNSPSRR
ncbi:repressor protein c2 [Pseudomonas sp. MT-1]|nr:repressor protein c2 [Pseudomonas sp. MT-1]